MYIRYFLLTSILVLLTILTCKASSTVDHYFVIDTEFQKDISLKLDEAIQRNVEHSNKKVIGLFKIAKMRDLEHGVILKILDYVYLIYIISLVINISLIYETYKKGKQKK